LTRGSKDDQQDEHDADELYTEREEDAACIHPAPVEPEATYEMPYEGIEGDHAKEDKRDQRNDCSSKWSTMRCCRSKRQLFYSHC
jgi:hypothetical protein